MNAIDAYVIGFAFRGRVPKLDVAGSNPVSRSNPKDLMSAGWALI